MRISDWSSDVCSSDLGFEAGVAEGDDQGVEDVGDGAGDDVAFGERPWVGFVLEGAEAVKLEFGEDVVGRGRGVFGFEASVVVIGAHGVLPRRIDRDRRGLHGDERRRAERRSEEQTSELQSIKRTAYGVLWFK